MRKQRKPLVGSPESTSMTLIVALFGAMCALFSAESLGEDFRDLEGPRLNWLASWQLHMGSVCIGTAAFVAGLFLLEVFETKSKKTAWRISSPWLPLIVLTLLATAVHIPSYVVIVIGFLYGIWAYRRTLFVADSQPIGRRG
jgi:hypothetical protein